MPGLDYAQRFGRYGSNVGGAAGGAAGATGGGLLGRLGELLEPLDYPRQALANLGSTVGSALDGTGTWEDALKAAPGAIGTVAGLAAAPFGGFPLAMLAGSLAGGAAQGIGKMADPERFKAPTVEDVTGTDEMLPNLLVGALTDPLTYAGGLGGARKGALAGEKAGAAFGKGLEEQALARGPRYGTDPSKIGAMMKTPKWGEMERENEFLSRHVANLLQNPAALNEFHPNSIPLGAGVESFAALNPEMNTVTLARRPNADVFDGGRNLIDYGQGVAPPTRPALEEFVQPARSVGFGGENPLRVEHVPLARMLSDEDFAAVKRAVANGEKPDVVLQRNALIRSMELKGFNPADLHYGNIGQLHGETKIVDPGSVFAGKQSIPLGPEAQPVPPTWRTWAQDHLLNAIGADQDVRSELARRLNDPEAYSQMVKGIVNAEPSAYLTASGPGGRNVVMRPGEFPVGTPHAAEPSLEEALGVRARAAAAAQPPLELATNNIRRPQPSPVDAEKAFIRGGANPLDASSGGSIHLEVPSMEPGGAAPSQWGANKLDSSLENRMRNAPPPTESQLRALSAFENGAPPQDSWLRPGSAPLVPEPRPGGLEPFEQAQRRFATLDNALQGSGASQLPASEAERVYEALARAQDSLVGHVGNDAAMRWIEKLRQARMNRQV